MTLDLRLGSLRAKLVALMAALLVAIGGFLLAFFPARLERAAMTGMERRATGVASVLSAAVAPGLEFDDAANVKDLLEHLRSADGVLYAAVRRADGSLFAAWHGESVPPFAGPPGSEPTIAVHDGRLDLTNAVRARGGASGSLTIGFSLAELEREQRQNLVATLLVVAVVLGVGLLASFVFGTYFVRPIRRMTALALQIARGDLSQPAVEHRGRDEVGRMAEAFDRMLRSLRGLAAAADEVAAGDLSHRLEVEGQVADAFNRMIEAQRLVVRQIAETSERLRGAAAEMYGASQDQEAAAMRQSSGVAGVNRTMGALLAGAGDISDSAKGVLANAEQTRHTAGLTAQKLAELSGHTSRIGEILEVIRDIADRSDLLALNASIEGSRAGEAGRTFSLVAAEMRRLAERVTASVADVKALVSDVAASGAATVAATEEGRRLAASTTDSARAITAVTLTQRTGTEEVSRSLAEIEGVLAQSVSATRRTRALAEDLKARAGELGEVVGRFRLGGDG